MTTPEDNERPGGGRIYGPTDADIERYGSEKYEETLREHRRRAGPAFWKLLAGAVSILFAAAMILNVFIPAITRNAGSETPRRVIASVTRVLDASTIAVEMNGTERTVRYIGVQPPLPGETYYEVSIATNEAWLTGRQVELEADAQDADSEGRLLRYVWLDGAMVNLDLVGVGLARAGDSGANNRYAPLFRQVEQNARGRGLGIWSEQASQPAVMLRPAAALPGGALPSR